MAKKSPAFNFYSSDFLTGTSLMNYTQKGKYIYLLCLQHQQGHLEADDFIDIVGDDKKLLSKFVLDQEGKYYNEVLERVVKQKEVHIEKQRENAYKRWNKDTKNVCDGNAMAMPLEIEIEIEDNNSNKEYYSNSILNDLFVDFLELRKKLKAQNTDRAITLLKNKLDPFPDEVKIKMIEQSIENSWKGLFDLKKSYENNFEKGRRLLSE
jgi:hypothetical protein